MAGSRPPVLPSWSTTVNYPAGALDWSGKATRVQPSAPVAAQGLIPATGLAAEYLNWLLGVGFDFVGYLDSWWNPPTTSSNLPQLRFLDAAGNGRFLVDHNGFPTGGRLSRFDENWMGVAIGAAGSPWAALLGAGASLVMTNLAANYNARYVTITPSSSGGATLYSMFYSSLMVLANAAGMSLALEFEIGLNAAAAGIASNTTWFFGLDAGTDPGGVDNNLIGLRKKYNNANYDFLTGNGSLQAFSAASIATTPATAAVPTDRIRIEIQGSASPYGAYQARFFVNEVLIGTVAAANLPGAVALRLLMGSYNEGGVPAGSPVGYVGPVTAIWNRLTSGPNL